MKRLARSLALLLVIASAAPALSQTPDEQLAAAAALYDARKYQEAAQRLESFLAENPPAGKIGVAAFTLGRCYSELTQHAKAVPAYERAIASADPAVVANAQVGLCEAAVQAAQWEKAAAALDTVVKGPLKPEQAPVLWYWRGQANFQLERYAEAEQSYLKVTQDYSMSDVIDGAYFGAAVAALRQKKGPAARERFQTVITRFPKSEERPRSLLLLAQLDLDEKRFKEARDGFQSLVREPALNSEAREIQKSAEEGLIRSLIELQDFAAAADHLDRLMLELPSAQRARGNLTLGNCRYRLKQYEQALIAYKEASRAMDSLVAGEGLYWAGNCCLALNRPTEAAPLFEELVARHPMHPLAPRAQLKAGDAHAAAKKMDAAALAYQKVTERFPQAPEAEQARKSLVELGGAVTDPAQLAALLKNLPAQERTRGTLRLARLHLEAKQYPAAEAALSGLLKETGTGKEAAEARYLLGLTYDVEQKSEPAAAALAAALTEDGSAAWAIDAHGRLAWLYLDLKQPAKAEASAAAVLGMKPGEEAERQARLALVQACVDQKKWQPALDHCAALLKNKLPGETMVTLVFTQAWAHEQLGKPEEALIHWERLLADHRKSEYAPDALVHVGDARFKAERYEEARGFYTSVINEFPKSPLAGEAGFKLGSSLYHLNRFADAAAQWDRVAADTTAGEWSPESLYWAGVALEKGGSKAEAARRFEQLVTQHPKHPRVITARVRLAALKAVLK